jgi:hypothetical protein
MERHLSRFSADATTTNRSEQSIGSANPVSWRTASVALVLALLAPGFVDAKSIDVRSDSFVTAGGTRPEFGASDTRSRVVFLQYIGLRTEDVGLDNLHVEVSGLAGVHLADPPLVDPATEGDRADGELIVGLVRWRTQGGAFSMALGRQYLFAGAGRAEQLDGLSVTYRSPWNLDLTLFGGRTTPWQVDYAPDQGDPDATNESFWYSNYAAGGRLRFRLLEQAVASAGFVHEGHGDQIVRQSLTVDVGYYNFRVIEALAGGVVDLVQGAPQEIWLQLISRPRHDLKLSLDYTYQVPSLTIPKTSIFSVFTTDAYHDASAVVDWGLSRRITLGVEGGLRLYPEDEELVIGFTAAGSLRVALGDRPGRHIGARVQVVDSGDELFVQSRLFARYQLDVGLYGTAELYLLYLGPDGDAATRSIFQQRAADNALSVGGLGLLGYRFSPSLSAQLAGSIFSTPRAKQDLRALVRLSYTGAWGGGS